MIKEIQRPIWDDRMKKQLAQIVGEKIKEWAGSDESLEDCIEVSEEVLEYGSNDSGYELAKRFEDKGFCPDVELVEILDSVQYEKYDIYENFMKKWVSENNLILRFSIGKKVIARLPRDGEIECEIVKLYPETLKYGLWHEGMSYEKGKGHTIVNAENIIRTL